MYNNGVRISWSWIIVNMVNLMFRNWPQIGLLAHRCIKGPLRFLLRPQDSKYFISNITLYPYSMNTSSLIKYSAYIPESERTTKNGILWAASENDQFWRGHNLKIGSDGPNLMKYSESLCPHYSRVLCSC